MDKPAELREQLSTLRTEIRGLSEKEEILTPEEETRFAAALEEYQALEVRAVAAETRAKQVDAVRASATRWESAADTPGQINRTNPFEGDVRSATRGELRNRAMAAIEERGKRLTDRQKTGLATLLDNGAGDADGATIARRLLITESDAYRSAFMKGISGRQGFTPEEVNALEEFRALESRAASEGTTTAGGFGVPVLIDPSIILTSGASSAPILDIARVITITTNQWKGVSSAGMTWSYDAEASVVSDDTPTFAQPTIPVYAARGFIPYSLEIGQDYPGFESEMSRLLEQGYVNLLAITTMTGTGVAQPTGIFTAMQTGSGAPTRVTVTTSGTLGAVDVRKAWGALPERFRPNATYVMSTQVENAVRAWGNGLALSDYTVNMLADGTSQLTGRPVKVSDYAPAFTGTTGAASYMVVGDFQNYVVVQRAGMTVELVPHLFDPTTGRPTGQRGWFAFARHGADVATSNAFRLVSNT